MLFYLSSKQSKLSKNSYNKSNQWFCNLVILGLSCVLLINIQVQAQQVAGFKGLTGNSYIERQLLCALERAPCDVLGKQIKDALPEIIGNNCQNCDQRQLVNAKRIAQFVQSKYPDVWFALLQKYRRN